MKHTYLILFTIFWFYVHIIIIRSVLRGSEFWNTFVGIFATFRFYLNQNFFRAFNAQFLKKKKMGFYYMFFKVMCVIFRSPEDALPQIKSKRRQKKLTNLFQGFYVMKTDLIYLYLGTWLTIEISFFCFRFSVSKLRSFLQWQNFFTQTYEIHLSKR